MYIHVGLQKYFLKDTVDIQILFDTDTQTHHRRKDTVVFLVIRISHICSIFVFNPYSLVRCMAIPHHCHHETEDIQTVQLQLKDIHQWMSSNFLKLNSGKTEVLVMGTYQQLAKLNIQSLNVDGVQVNLQ